MRLQIVVLSTCILFFGIHAMASGIKNSGIKKQKLSEQKEISGEEVIARQRDLEEKINKITKKSEVVSDQLGQIKQVNRRLLKQKSLEENRLEKAKLELIEASLMRMALDFIIDSRCKQKSVDFVFIQQLDQLLSGDRDTIKERFGLTSMSNK